MKKNFLALFFIVFSIISVNFLKSSELGLKGLGELLRKYNSLIAEVDLNNLKQAMDIMQKLAADEELAKLCNTNSDYNRLFYKAGISFKDLISKSGPLEKPTIDEYYKVINKHKSKIANKFKIYNFLDNPNKNDLDEFLKIFNTGGWNYGNKYNDGYEGQQIIFYTREKILDQLYSNHKLAELYSTDEAVREIFKHNGFVGDISTEHSDKTKLIAEYSSMILNKKTEFHKRDEEANLLTLFHYIVCDKIKKIDEMLMVRDLINSKLYGKTPLISAVEYSKKDLVEKFIELGANVNAIGKGFDGDEKTALLIAVERSRYTDNNKIITILICNGADVTIRAHI